MICIKAKKIFFVIYIKKEWHRTNPNRYKTKEICRSINKKEQYIAIRNDISFSIQKMPFHFQFCQLCPKTARPECFIKLPPADLT